MSRPALRPRWRVLRRALMATAGALACAAPASAYPGFYEPPAPLPDGPPGTVIRSEAVNYSRSWTKPPRGTRIWRMLYTSENALGQPIAVSGAVYRSHRYGLSPQRRPLIAYALGSQGTGDRCAPSRRINNGGVQDFLVINILLDRGYDVVVSDYEGLGTPGDHAYGVNLSAAHSVLDMVRAARNLDAAGMSAAAPTMVYGYSQGGGAAGMTAELQPSYAPDVPLRGVVAGGVLADPYAAGKSLDGGKYAGYLFAAAVGYDATYPELHLANFLNERGVRERSSTILDLCFDDILSTYTGFHISDVTTSNPMDTPAWRARLAQNALGKTAPAMPVYMFHSKADQQLPYAATVALRQQWCAKGANVEWHPYAGLAHFETAVVGLPDALRWIDQRLRGRPVRSGCR